MQILTEDKFITLLEWGNHYVDVMRFALVR